MTYRVMIVYGTRPEAIKVAPLIRAIDESAWLSGIPVVTGQHREMLDQVNDLFGIRPQHDLDVMMHGQGLSRIFSRVAEGVDGLLADQEPDAVVVQGDTTTSTAAALAAFYRQIPVFHLEAGLRSGDNSSPFPEEANRKVTSHIASLHLAPTASSRRNLLAEGINQDSVVVTGNTVIDALLTAGSMHVRFSDSRLEQIAASPRPLVLVTTHRRENWGEATVGIARAIGRIAAANPGVDVLLPLHRNPVVREALEPELRGCTNVVLTEPLPYAEFTHVLSRCSFVLTDSGGIQEEAPSLGKPVLVMRDTTERPEAVQAGAVKVVGTSEDRIVTEAQRLLTDPAAYASMAYAGSPYGDGSAARRAVAAMEYWFGVGVRLPDFGV